MQGLGGRNPRAEIDRLSRQFVETIKKTMRDDEGQWLPRSQPPAARADREFLDEGETRLLALGFVLAGDYQPDPMPPGADVCYRIFLAKDGLTIAKLLTAPLDEDHDRVRAVFLYSRFADGSSNLMSRGFPPRFPEPPSIREWFVESGLPIEQMIRSHEIHATLAAKERIPFSDAAEVFRYFDAMESASVSWRRAQGLTYYELFLRRLMGDRYDPAGELVMDAIRAHPRWLDEKAV